MEEYYQEPVYEEETRESQISWKLVFIVLGVAVAILVALFSCRASYVPYEPGKIVDEENCYKNRFFNIQFQCPEGYQMRVTEVTENEANDMLGTNFNGSASNVFQELTVDSTNSSSGMSLAVMRGSVDMTSGVGKLAIKYILNSMVGQLDGLSYELSEPYLENFGGQDFDAMNCDLDAYGTPMRMTIFSRTEKGYTMVISFFEFNESINDLYEAFAEYKK